jgi:hypothetical protein
MCVCVTLPFKIKYVCESVSVPIIRSYQLLEGCSVAVSCQYLASQYGPTGIVPLICKVVAVSVSSSSSLALCKRNKLIASRV